MRLGAQRQDEFEINVISLIDVMLTLLMFFVLTATFEQRSRLKVALPQASETAEHSLDHALVLMVDREGHYFVDGSEVLQPGADALKDALQRLAGDDHERPVLLRADAQTPHQAVVTAMDALGQLGFTHLSIATTPARDSQRK